MAMSQACRRTQRSGSSASAGHAPPAPRDRREMACRRQVRLRPCARVRACARVPAGQHTNLRTRRPTNTHKTSGLAVCLCACKTPGWLPVAATWAGMRTAAGHLARSLPPFHHPADASPTACRPAGMTPTRRTSPPPPGGGGIRLAACRAPKTPAWRTSCSRPKWRLMSVASTTCTSRRRSSANCALPCA